MSDDALLKYRRKPAPVSRASRSVASSPPGDEWCPVPGVDPSKRHKLPREHSRTRESHLRALPCEQSVEADILLDTQECCISFWFSSSKWIRPLRRFALTPGLGTHWNSTARRKHGAQSPGQAVDLEITPAMATQPYHGHITQLSVTQRVFGSANLPPAPPRWSSRSTEQ
jgi:hypothetical protein